MFTSLFDSVISSLVITDALICIAASLVFGLAISVTCLFTDKCTKSFAISLVILPVIVQVVIMMVNGNLGTGVAILGAFSLVRFRSAQGNSKEISIVFASMAVGLANGMGYLSFSAVITAVVCVILLILSLTKFAEKRSYERQLKVIIPESLEYNGVFDDIFREFTSRNQLIKVKTTNLGSMFELSYIITLKDPLKEKAMIDQIRCRNGNLLVSCGVVMPEGENL